jgi:hypothetical protein
VRVAFLTEQDPQLLLPVKTREGLLSPLALGGLFFRFCTDLGGGADATFLTPSQRAASESSKPSGT